MKTERELFEEWYSSTYHETVHTLPNGQYASLRQQHSWDAWQASAQREGYKLVPVETLEECLSWATCASSESWSDEQRDEIDKHYKVIEKAMIGVV